MRVRVVLRLRHGGTPPLAFGGGRIRHIQLVRISKTESINLQSISNTKNA